MTISVKKKKHELTAGRYASVPLRGTPRTRVTEKPGVGGAKGVWTVFRTAWKKTQNITHLPAGCVCVCVFSLCFRFVRHYRRFRSGGGDSKVDHRCRLRCGRRWSEIVFGHQSRRQYYPVVLRLKLYFFFAYTNSRRYFYQFSKILTVTIGRAQIFYLFYVRNKTKNVVITSKIHEFRE